MQGWSCESHLWTIFIGQSDIVKVIAFSSLPNVLFHTATHWTGTATKSGDSGKSGDNIEPGDSCESGDNEKAGDSETAGDTGDFYFLDGSGNSEESGDFGESDVSGEWWANGSVVSDDSDESVGSGESDDSGDIGDSA